MFGHMQTHLELSLPRAFTNVLNIFHGVPIFFFLSGYLIFISLSKQRDLKSFFNKRILRLYPELWICLVFEILSIVICYDAHVPILDYIKFIFTQGTVLQFWTPDSLRAYGVGCPNGSLWTVTVIVQFYVLIYLLSNWLKKTNITVWIVLIVCSILYPLVLVPLINQNIPEIAAKLLGQTVFNYLWIFMLGSFTACYSNALLPWLKKFWYVSLVALLFVRSLSLDVNNGNYSVLGTILLGLFIIGAAYRFPKLNVKKDISYGIYIYHMVFVNIAVHLGFMQNWYMFGFVVLATVLFSYGSYITVGGLYRKKKQSLSVSTRMN